MRRSTMFAIGGILCFLLAIYVGVLVYLFRGKTLPMVGYSVLCVVSLFIGITTFLRARHYKNLEKARFK